MELLRKWDWAEWTTPSIRTYFKGTKCDECENTATHIALADDSEDTELLKSRCDNHFNKLTQKTWLKAWRKKNCKN